MTLTSDKTAFGTTRTALPERLLRLSDVLAILPVSKSTFYSGIRTSRYPAPVRDGRNVYWLSSEIQLLIEGWITVRASSPKEADHASW